MSAAGAAAGTGAAATDAAATDAATDSDEQHSKGPGAGAAGGSTLLDAHDTTLTACALEACCWPDLDLRDPSESSGGSSGSSCWVVCGTYQLVKGAEAEAEGSGSSKGDRREGSLLLYQLLGGEEDGRQRLVPRQALALKEEGVLDCKWRPSSSSPGQQRRRPLLACATSRGRITTYTLEEADAPAAGGGTRDEEEEEEEHGPLLQLVPGPASDDDSGSSACMALALEWARGSATGEEGEAVVASSNNDGTACVHRLRDEGGVLEEVARWDAHSLYGSPIEVWTTAFAGDMGGQLLLTGGDDCALRMWDLRCLDPARPVPVWSDTRSHGAGVTSLQAFGAGGAGGEEEQEESWYFASGSYDGVLRLWDRRKNRGRPVLSHQTDVGGGIWRIKFHHPRRQQQQQQQRAEAAAGGGEGRLVALACMHAGAAVLRVPVPLLSSSWEEEAPAEVVARHEGHTSMAYGIDWILRGGGDGGGEEEGDGSSMESMLLASCSFYDHALHLWRPGRVVGE